MPGKNAVIPETCPRNKVLFVFSFKKKISWQNSNPYPTRS